MAVDHDSGSSGLFAGALAAALPADGRAADASVLLHLHDALLDELAHPGEPGAWAETWRRIAEQARDGSPEAWLDAVEAASDVLHLATDLARQSSLGLLQLSDLVRLAWPHLCALGERPLVPA